MNGFMLIVPIMICIAVGWLLKRLNVIDDAGGAQMGRLVYYVAVPCLLFRVMLTLKPEDFSDRVFIWVLHGGYFVLMLLAAAVARLRGGSLARQAAEVTMAIRSNNIFMGMPAVLMLWGESSMAVYGRFVAISIIGFESLAALGGLLVLHGGFNRRALRMVGAALLRNPAILSLAAGLFWCFVVKIPLPNWLDMSMKILSELGTGLALITLGMKLKIACLPNDFKLVWPDVLIRLLIAPLIYAIGFKLFPSDPAIARICVLVMAMPEAVNTTPMAQVLGMDADYTARMVMLSTVLSVVTMPLVIRFML